MAYKQLFIWVEGADDYEFFSEIIEPYLKGLYPITIVEYSRLPKFRIKAYFNSIKAMNADYIFVADSDEVPCITQKLDKLEQIYPFCKRRNMQVVVKEIEGWYIAGLSKKSSEQLKLKSFHDTNSLTKEQFNQLIPSKYDSRRDFMSELLKRFSMQTAVSKNKSFRYFVEKYNLETSA